MINDIEKEFVEKFIVKNKRDRILFELSNPRKKSNIMMRRLVSLEYFDKSVMQHCEYTSSNILKAYLCELNMTNDVFFIGNNYVGNMSLDRAITRADNGEICIIYCGNGIGYYQGEQEKGKQPRYLMCKK